VLFNLSTSRARRRQAQALQALLSGIAWQGGTMCRLQLHHAVTQHRPQQRRQVLVTMVLLFWASEITCQRSPTYLPLSLARRPETHDPWVAHTDRSRHLHSMVPGCGALGGPSARHLATLLGCSWLAAGSRLALPRPTRNMLFL
jgi:hypothetical protein